MLEETPAISRTTRFINGLFTGYAALGSSVVYTLASVPLALHYLTKEEFGLWALITQLTGYLMLLEFGMSGSIARFLGNHKDDMDGGEYGSVLVTGFAVFFLQGLTVVVLGIIFVLMGTPLLGIPPHLRSIFTQLGIIQACAGGLALMTRAVASPLWPHQRLDINNLASIACQFSSLSTLWFGFQAGWKLYSLSVAAIVSFLLGLAITVHACIRLRLYPRRGHWGGFDMGLFRKMISYGSGLFVLNLGTQLVSTSQVIVISKGLGLESASIWAVSTKLSILIQQFVNRIFETSAAGFVEMLVRGETVQLRRRLRDLVILSSTIAGIGAVGLAMFNRPFVAIWTSGKVSWPGLNDSLLGVVIFLYCVGRFHVGFASLSKDVHKIKYIIFAEGVSFVGLAFPLSSAYGLTGILMASIMANLLTTFGGSILVTGSHLNLRWLSVISWVSRPALLIIGITVLHATVSVRSDSHVVSYFSLSAQIAAFLLLIVPTFLYVGLTTQLRSEIWLHMSSAFRSLSERVALRLK